VPRVPALYKAPGLPQLVPSPREARAPLTLKGAAHSWSMGFAPEASPADDAEAEMRLLTPAGLHDPAEGVAFALWNEGRKDEAIEFLERQIAREREPGGGHSVPTKGRAAFRAVGAGAFAVVLIAVGAALWVNRDEAAGFFGRTAIMQAQAEAEAREDPLAAAEKNIESAPELAEVAPEVEVTPEVDVISETTRDTVPGLANGSADVREIALWEPAAPVSPAPMQDSTAAAEPDPQPEADAAEAFTAAAEVEPEEDADLAQGSVIPAEPEAGAPLAESSAAVARPEPEAVPEVAQAATDTQPERQAPLDHLRVAAALQAGAQMAAAEVETQSSPPAEAAPQSPAPVEPVATLDAVASADPIEPEGGPRADAEPAPPVIEARLPRARPESATAIAEAPARAAVVAAADNPPPVEALVPVLPMHPEPYPPMVFEPAPLPPELAYNRARAERYLAMRRAMAERRAGGRVYVAPPPQYGDLEIIGRVPGW
jgi:hypothetical protein